MLSDGKVERGVEYWNWMWDAGMEDDIRNGGKMEMSMKFGDGGL